MSLLPKRYTVTAALPYANGPVHIGHLAGVYLPADIYVRYLRSAERDVKFICGSDEHGVPITIRAQKEGVTPQQVVDKYHAIIRDSFRDFNVSFDVYSRTSSATQRASCGVWGWPDLRRATAARAAPRTTGADRPLRAAPSSVRASAAQAARVRRRRRRQAPPSCTHSSVAQRRRSPE